MIVVEMPDTIQILISKISANGSLWLPIIIALFSLGVSVLSLGVSALVAWLTLFQRGELKMTRPTLIVLQQEQLSAPKNLVLRPKIIVCMLLYTTGKKGHVINNMLITLSQHRAKYHFGQWYYAHEKDALRGRGLFVGDTGISLDHHFEHERYSTPLPSPSPDFSPCPSGKLTLEVFAELVGKRKLVRIFSTILDVTAEDADILRKDTAGLWFNWDSTKMCYKSKMHLHQTI